MFYYIFSIATSYFDKLLVFYETLAYIVVPILYFAFVLLKPFNFNTRIYLVHIAIYYEQKHIILFLLSLCYRL